MKRFVAAAIIAGFCCTGIATKSFAAARVAHGAAVSDNSTATDFSSRRRLHHRRHYALRYAGPPYEPTYYGRPVLYRPYGLVTLPFGLIIPYRP